MKTSSFKSSNSKSVAKSTPITAVPSNFKLTAKPLSTLIINSEAGKRQLTGAEHWGIDLRATSDTNIFATHNAVVIKAGWSDNCNETITNRGYGRTLVLMDEETKMLTLYAHLNSYLVNKGDHVIAGQTIIAKSGNSGHSNGAHLHFEVIDGNVNINGSPIWQQIKNSPNGITTFSKGRGGTLGVNNDVGRFNPRLLLADLALDLARQELGSQATEEQIKTRSCSIFSCDVIAQPASISLEGDRRANLFTRVNGNVKSLEFRFPDVSKIGKDVIDVKEVIEAGGKPTVSKLILENQEVTYQTSKCSCVAESDLTVVSNKWVMNHNGKNYNLKRVNEEGQIDSAGKDLVIITSSDTSDQNIIKIRNFNCYYMNGQL